VAAGANEADRDAVARGCPAIGTQNGRGHDLRRGSGEANRGGGAVNETSTGETSH